jgi:hypothetical protein
MGCLPAEKTIRFKAGVPCKCVWGLGRRRKPGACLLSFRVCIPGHLSHPPWLIGSIMHAYGRRTADRKILSLPDHGLSSREWSLQPISLRQLERLERIREIGPDGTRSPVKISKWRLPATGIASEDLGLPFSLFFLIRLSGQFFIVKAAIYAKTLGMMWLDTLGNSCRPRKPHHPLIKLVTKRMDRPVIFASRLTLSPKLNINRSRSLQPARYRTSPHQRSTTISQEI